LIAHQRSARATVPSQAAPVRGRAPCFPRVPSPMGKRSEPSVMKHSQQASCWLCTRCGETNLDESAQRCGNQACKLLYSVSGVWLTNDTANKKRKATHERSARLEIETSPLRRRVNAPPPPAVPPASPPAKTEAAVNRPRRKMRPHVVSEVDISDPEGYAAARALVTWQRLHSWANTKQRTVVKQKDLARLFDFTTKLLLVRRHVAGAGSCAHTRTGIGADKELIGCALLCEARGNQGACDSIGPHTNPSLPLVKTARMTSYGPIREAHIRAGFPHATSGDVPVDELVLICGEAGTGAAVMTHLKAQENPHRVLFASVVPGSEQALRFYDKAFKRLAFERADGEIPYAVWLGAE